MSEVEKEESKTGLVEIQVPSTGLEPETSLVDAGGDVTLRYVWLVEGRKHTSGFRFHRTRAYRSRAESLCTVWHIDAYDTLTEVINSRWISELEADEHWPDWIKRHFMIYIDSDGCYEVAAESWSWLPEEIVPADTGEVAGP